MKPERCRHCRYCNCSDEVVPCVICSRKYAEYLDRYDPAPGAGGFAAPIMSEISKQARLAWEYYIAFRSQGFKEEQAFQLTMLVHKGEEHRHEE